MNVASPRRLILSLALLVAPTGLLAQDAVLTAPLSPAIAPPEVHRQEMPQVHGWHPEYIIEDILRDSKVIRIIRLERALDQGQFVTYEGRQVCFAKDGRTAKPQPVRFNSASRFRVGDLLLVYDFERAGVVVEAQPDCNAGKDAGTPAAALPDVRIGRYLVVHKYEDRYAAFIQTAFFSTRLDLELTQELNLDGSIPLITKIVNEYNADGMYVDLMDLLQASGWQGISPDELP